MALQSGYAKDTQAAVQLLCLQQPWQPPKFAIQVRHECPGSSSPPQIPQATLFAPLLLVARNLFAAMPYAGEVANVKVYPLGGYYERAREHIGLAVALL